MLACWNIRGCNDAAKNRELRNLVASQNLCLLGILETKVKATNEMKRQRGLLQQWHFVSSLNAQAVGRIWVGWDPARCSIRVVNKSDQWVHCSVNHHEQNLHFFLTVVYGATDTVARRHLWDFLEATANTISNTAWAVIGDFNATRMQGDRKGGNLSPRMEDMDFNQACYRAELDDLKTAGCEYTWFNRQTRNPIFRKLDRVLVNSEWIRLLPTSEAIALPPSISDHSPIILNITNNRQKVKKVPFKFFNIWLSSPNFQRILEDVWAVEQQGVPMFTLYAKMKRLKTELKKFNKTEYYNISGRAEETKTELRRIQQELLGQQGNEQLVASEAMAASRYYSLTAAEESIAKQKSRINWLKLGDRNTAFFHHSMRRRQNRNCITSVKLENGSFSREEEDIKTGYVEFFKRLYGSQRSRASMETSKANELVAKKLSSVQKQMLSIPISDMEIKETIFSLGKNKAPGPDGYTTEFYTSSWSIVGAQVTEAIKDFFHHGKMLREVSNTVISLIPKVKNPMSQSDYRPISCCNVIYKCITKILANRIKKVLPDLVGKEQTAFVPGRRGADSILLAHELVHSYQSRRLPPRCLLKVDLMKAFDSVDWTYLNAVLLAFGFPAWMVDRIMKCITTVRYSISLNGEMVGFFPGARGLQQGDPLSPLLFTLVMETLSATLRTAANDKGFRFHWRCHKLKLTHLCFADDLLIFCRAEKRSVSILLNALRTFAEFSGLTMNPTKSFIFTSRTRSAEASQLAAYSGFQEGALPVTHLGIPLVTSRLRMRDCSKLVDIFTHRMQHWTSRFLSYAGRLQLINSVLFSVQTYWATIFIIPAGVLRTLERMMANFLWSGSTSKAHRLKPRWEEVTLPRSEGGLGIKRLEEWNRAASIKHVWLLIAGNSGSIWTEWVKTYLLKGQTIWTAKVPTRSSWAWRNLLSLRHLMIQLIAWRVGDGSRISFWQDPWLPCGTLNKILGANGIKKLRMNPEAKVCEFYNSSLWLSFVGNNLNRKDKGKVAVLQKLAALIPSNAPTCANMEDKIIWLPNKQQTYSIKSAWEATRSRAHKVPWRKLIWFKEAIPRFAFTMWLVTHNKLPTLDRLQRVGIISSNSCPVCHAEPESVDHLFFACSYSRQTWAIVMAGLPVPQPTTWAVLLHSLSRPPANQLLQNADFKRRISALVYYIWLERNYRNFEHLQLTPSSLARLVNSAI